MDHSIQARRLGLLIVNKDRIFGNLNDFALLGCHRLTFCSTCLRIEIIAERKT